MFSPFIYLHSASVVGKWLTTPVEATTYHDYNQPYRFLLTNNEFRINAITVTWSSLSCAGVQVIGSVGGN